ncbi:MAG TPA: MBL fold metallo-hydrolase [Streptosporangiaceae bacterium]|nr:MBL fold metallo-hydrolase [Streptosporangiaceae bacterium]
MTGSPGAPANAAAAPVTVTGVAQQQAWRARELPPVEQVTPGVWSVPVTIPDNPLRYTLSYLLLADSGVVVVDPGWESDTGWSDLQRGLAAARVSADRITGIVVTHVHLDHHGLSRRLSEASGAWIAMHAEEVHALPARIGETVGPDGGRAWLARCGAPEEMMAEFNADLADTLGIFRLADPDVLLQDGETLDFPGRRIRVVWTPGHTPGHICLHDAEYDLLLTGDHLLPRISPNIGIFPGGLKSPLTSYLDSLRAMPEFDAAEALPAHEYRFRGIAARSRDIARHHDARAREVLDIVAAAGQPTIWAVTERLTWSRTWDEITGFMRRAALAETHAHAEYLQREGRLLIHPGSPGEPDRLQIPRHGNPGA